MERFRNISLKSLLRKAGGTRRRRIAWLSVILTALIIVAVAGFIMRPRTQEPPLPRVEVETVTTGDVNIYGEYVGRIRAQQFVEIHARVEGYLEKMCFKEGSHIDKGQTLFIIDPKLYQAHVNKARAILNKAQAQARKAKHDLDRITPLYAQNAASQLDLDNATAAYESAMAEVTVSQADLTQAELTLSYTRVSSPIAGYISERVADIDTLLGKDRNVNLGSDDPSRKWNSYVTVTLADGSQYPYEGLVDFADPQVDPKTGTFSVRAEMPNPDRSLLPGEFTKVKVLLDVRENAVEIPYKALVIEKNGAYVFVVRPDGVVEKRFVEIGPQSGNNIIVERGLAKGEKIVVEGYHKLSHGMKVDAIEAPADSVPAVNINPPADSVPATGKEG